MRNKSYRTLHTSQFWVVCILKNPACCIFGTVKKITKNIPPYKNEWKMHKNAAKCIRKLTRHCFLVLFLVTCPPWQVKNALETQQKLCKKTYKFLPRLQERSLKLRSWNDKLQFCYTVLRRNVCSRSPLTQCTLIVFTFVCYGKNFYKLFFSTA